MADERLNEQNLSDHSMHLVFHQKLALIQIMMLLNAVLDCFMCIIIGHITRN